MPRIPALLAILALGFAPVIGTAQATRSAPELEAFLFSNVFAMEMTPDQARVEETRMRAHFDEVITELRADGLWDEMDEEQRAFYRNARFEPVQQTVELIPGIGQLIIDDIEGFPTVTIDPHVFSVSDDAGQPRIVVRAGSTSNPEIMSVEFDESRLTLGMDLYGETAFFTLTPTPNESASDRAADADRLSGTWRLTHVEDAFERTRSTVPVPIHYDFKADGSFEIRIDEAVDGIDTGFPPHGIWWLSALHVPMYDAMHDERYAGRLLVLASEEAGRTAFTVTTLDDTALELRGESTYGMPTLRLAR